MSSNLSSGQMSRSASAPGPKPPGAAADATAEAVERDALSSLQRDVASLRDTLARLASQAGGEATKTVRNVSETVAAQFSSAAGGVADAGSEFAASAGQHAKTFASELEGMAQRNPLGTIAGALLVGVIIGMMMRGRS
jgi:ElaB/YqjD/DUF883 family membrane-anchored ribosome-binding protein